MKLDDISRSVRRLRKKKEAQKNKEEPITIRLVQDSKPDRIITCIPNKRR